MKEVNDHSFSVNVASQIGLEKSILHKEIYGWVKHNWDNQKNIHHGVAWTYNSAKAYAEKFPYFSERSIGRWLADLEDAGFITTGNFNEHKYDRTKWYAVNVDAYISLCRNDDPDLINSLLSGFKKHFTNLRNTIRQNGEGIRRNGEGISQDGEPIPSLTISLPSPNLSPSEKKIKEELKTVREQYKNLPDLGTQEVLEKLKQLDAEIKASKLKIVSEVIDYLNTKANTSFKTTTKETMQFVLARQKVDGWELEDFKLVIDFKVSDWGKDDRMKQYICPSTLFRASNAEKYMQAAKAWKESSKVGQNGQIRYSKEEKISPMKYDRVLPTPKINRV